MDPLAKDYPRFDRSTISTNGDVFKPSSSNNAKQRGTLVECLNGVHPDLNFPVNASDEELRAFLVDGSVLCRVLNKPGSITEFGAPVSSSQTRLENVQRFLLAVDKLGLPRFQAADLEMGYMKIVLDCLLTLQTHFLSNLGMYNGSSQRDEPFRILTSPTSLSDSKFQPAIRSPIRAESSAAHVDHVGHKFHEVFHLKQGSYIDIPAVKISEMMKSNSLDNSPTQLLLCVVNGILDETIKRENGEIRHHVACLLRKVVQELERRISTQAEHLRAHKIFFKAREEKYQSRIRVLEALAAETTEETQGLRLMKETESKNQEIANLKQELEIARRKHEQDYNHEVTNLKSEATRSQLKLENKLKQAASQQTQSGNKVKELEIKLKEAVSQLTESRNKVKDLEAFADSKSQCWSKKEHVYHRFTEVLLGALQELRFSSESIRQEIVGTQKSYSEDFSFLGTRIKAVDDASKNYYSLLAENRKMRNELQKLKGGIRSQAWWSKKQQRCEECQRFDGTGIIFERRYRL